MYYKKQQQQMMQMFIVQFILLHHTIFVKTIHYDNPWVRFLSRNGANQEPLASEDV